MYLARHTEVCVCCPCFPVMRYIKPDEEENLIAKLNKFSIHSIRKKSDRLTSYLKMLTGAEPLVCHLL